MSAKYPDDMTPAQRDAIRKAFSLLGEHFEHVLIALDWETEDEKGDRCNAHTCYWHGGAMACLGLAEFGKDRILHCGVLPFPQEPEPPAL